jgi:hypothetical protein
MEVIKMDYIYTNGELYHHGVKGMKWGVRKKDGLYTRLHNKRTKKTREKNNVYYGKQ